MTNRSLALGFAGWRHGIAFFVDHQCARVALETRATSASLRLMTSRAWRSWLSLIRIQVIVRSGFSHALNLTLRHSFANWMAASSPELQAALLFLTGTALSKGWRKWVRALVTRRTTLLEPKFRALLTRSKLMISKASEYRKRRQVARALRAWRAKLKTSTRLSKQKRSQSNWALAREAYQKPAKETRSPSNWALARVAYRKPAKETRKVKQSNWSKLQPNPLQPERGLTQVEASSVGKAPARAKANGSNGPSPLPRGVDAMASLQLERGPAQAEASSVGKVPARVEANGSNGPSPLPRGVGAVAKRTDLYQLHASTPRTEQPRVSKANTPWMLIRQNSASSLSSPKRLFD